MHVHETILGRLGKALQGLLDGVPQEPMPRRWVDLIRYLEEQEKRQADPYNPETERSPQ